MSRTKNIPDEIIRMAKASGIGTDTTIFVATRNELTRFFHMAQEAEREECARVCDEMDHNGVMIAADCAAAIRARGEAK